MILLNYLQKIFSSLLLWLTPVVLVIYSILIMLPDTEAHKSSLRANNFYERISQELKVSEVESNSLEDGARLLIWRSIFNNLANPGWLQNFIETNLDNTGKWLIGEEENWNFYIPAKEVEGAVTEQINSETARLVEEESENIPTCNNEESEKLKREGFSLENFCLPDVVKNGSQTLTEFIGISEDTLLNSQVLDQLLANNQLNTFSDTFEVESITNSGQKRFLGFINSFRDNFVWAYNQSNLLLSGWLIAVGINIIILKFSDRKLSLQLQRFLVLAAISTLSLAATLILLMGGSTYLSSGLQDFLLPSFGTAQITNLLAFEVLKIAFNLVSLSVWISLGLLGISQILAILEKRGTFDNNKMVGVIKRKREIQPDSNPTFDGAFQRARQEEDTPRINPIDVASYQNSVDYDPDFSRQQSFVTPSSTTSTFITSNTQVDPETEPMTPDEIKSYYTTIEQNTNMVPEDDPNNPVQVENNRITEVKPTQLKDSNPTKYYDLDQVL